MRFALSFHSSLCCLKESDVCMTTLYSKSTKGIPLAFASVSVCVCAAQNVCVSGKWSRWMAAEGLGCPVSGGSWRAKPGRGHPQGPCPLVASSRLSSTLALSSSSDLSSAGIGTAALPHDNGALLIIGDGVLAQVMTAKMHLSPSWDEQFGQSGMQPRRHGDNWSHCRSVYAIQRPRRWAVLLLAQIITASKPRAMGIFEITTDKYICINTGSSSRSYRKTDGS